MSRPLYLLHVRKSAMKWNTRLLSLLRYTLTRINSIRTWSYLLFSLHTLLITIEITKECKHYL